jgi:hypothetical protein
VILIHNQKSTIDLTKRFASILIIVTILFATLPLDILAADPEDVPNVNATPSADIPNVNATPSADTANANVAHADTAKKQSGLWYKTKILPAGRKAAADKFKKTYYATRVGKVPPGMDPGGVPHYFGP